MAREIVHPSIRPPSFSKITNSELCKKLPKECYVYSGLYATAQNLDQLEKELHSQQLLDYIIENGKPMQGNYVQIGSTLLKNF